MSKNFYKSAIMLSTVLFLMTGIAYAQESLIKQENQSGSDYLESVINMAKEKYGGEVTEKQLIEGALKGMFETMDPYTNYFNNEEADSFLGSIEGSYEGIGVSFSKEGEDLVVNEVFKASPAEDSGILQGDIIVEVDGVIVTGKTTEAVAALIKGEEGTTVSIGVIHAGMEEIRKYDVMRRKISISPVSTRIDGDVGYIKLDSFSSNSSRFMDEALNEMDKKNISKIILDLRDNPGGEVSQAVGISREFVPEGLITKLDFKAEDQTDYEYYSELEKIKYKLVVLVNKMSASASEILAGAVQDTGSGTLVGTKTFGKGKVQNIYPILSPEAYEKFKEELGEKVVNAYDLSGKFDIEPENYEVIGWTKITTGAYYTPKGRMIDGIGLDPDVYVENETTLNNVDVRSINKLKKTGKPALGTEGVDVYNAKKILMLMGYDIDTVDMIMDEKTYKAVMKFQESIGFFPYGVLDFSTQQALNDRLDELVKKLDKQYTKAIELLKD